MKTVILTSALLCALSVFVASAATRTVTNLNNSGLGSLREAIGLSLSGDLIVFDVEGEIQLESGLVTGRNLTIAGPGADRLFISQVGPHFSSSPLRVAAGTLTLSGVTIANGRVNTSGGGITVKNKATLKMTDCEVANCQALGISRKNTVVTNSDVAAGLNIAAESGGEARGGGIANFGKMILKNCTISGCEALAGTGSPIDDQTGNANPLKPFIDCTYGDGGKAYGGAIYNFGEALLENCTITGNQAGGGVPFNVFVDIQLDDTPNNIRILPGRGGNGLGGGIYTGNTNLRIYLTLRNCTISNNIASGNDKNYLPLDSGADEGGGVYVAFNTFSTSNPPILEGSIVAGNMAYTSSNAQDWRGVLTSSGYNLVGKIDGSGGFGGYDLAGLGVAPIDPGLTPLGYFGGSVRVMGLQPGSPAIDKGKSFSGNMDARGRPRRFDFATIPNQIDGDGADIGAFERHVPLHIDGNLDGNADILLEKTRTTRLQFMRRGAIAGILDGPTLPANNTLACAGRLSTDDALCYVVHDSAAGKVTVWRTDNGIKTSASPSERLPVGYAPAAVADFNGDGIEDFLLWKKSTLNTRVRFWNGEQFSGPEKNGPTLPAGFVPVGCGDFNGDGKPDIAIYNAQQNKLSVLLMNGSALLSTQLLPKPESGFAPTTVDDYNSDGNADVLLVRTATRETRFFFMSGTTLQRKADGPKIPFGYALK